MKVAGVIQARMGSTRLPGKALLPLAGKPLVGHIVDRMRRTGLCEQIVLATTMDPRNEPLVAWAEGEGLGVVRETVEDDIAARIARAVRLTGADVILKCPGDCPLVDPDVMRAMIRRCVEEDADFVSNRVRWTFPLGLSCDVISARAILWCEAHLRSAEERELVAIWIRDHPERFKVISHEWRENLSHHSWLVDTPEDYAFMSRLFDRLHREGACFGLEDVLRRLDEAGA